MPIGKQFGVALLTALAVGGAVPAAQADQIIPAGGTAIVAGGLYDLACTDLLVNGKLDIGTGTYVKVRNVTVGPSGVLQGTGTINYSGALANSGSVGPNVQLAVNTSCGLPPALAQHIPTLGNSMLAALAALLLLLGGLMTRENGVLRHRGGSRGAGK